VTTVPVELDARPDSLVERLRRGEVSAVGACYDAHHGAILAFARRLLGDDDAAQDLVHDVFVELPRAIRSFEGHSTLRTWLVSVALNMARHHVRSAIRRRAAIERFGREPEAAAPQGPEGEASRRELGAALSRALDTLPLDQRATFVLCDVEERASPEVAVITGVPEATVRTRLFHARRKLREALSREGVR